MFLSSQGSIVLPNIASSLYDPEHWETPRQFNPGHFLDKDGNFVSREAFLPFSIGKITDTTKISGLGWGCRSKTSIEDLLVIYFNPLCEKTVIKLKLFLVTVANRIVSICSTEQIIAWKFRDILVNVYIQLAPFSEGNSLLVMMVVHLWQQFNSRHIFGKHFQTLMLMLNA